MSKKITRRRALPRLALVVAAPAVAVTALRCTAVAAAEMPVLQGYGQCASCACPGFTGSYNICQNCGHNYQAHW